MARSVDSGNHPATGSARTSALWLPVLVTPVLLALSFVSPPRPDRLDTFAERLMERVTRAERVSIRIDAERRMVIDSATPPRPPRSATDAGWLVLDRRWLSAEGVGEGVSPRRDSLSYVGAVMSDDAHVAITPPFVVLTRGSESVLLRLDAGRLDHDEATPDWVRRDAERGIVVARFDGFSDIEIGAGTVRLQRRFFDW